MKIPTKREREMSRYVVSLGGKIAQAARVFAVSPSTIRRAMDKVTEFDSKKFTLTLNGEEWNEVMGWMRNGNVTSGELADKIAAALECGSIEA